MRLTLALLKAYCTGADVAVCHRMVQTVGDPLCSCGHSCGSRDQDIHATAHLAFVTVCFRSLFRIAVFLEEEESL